jgi:hypothetical protein
MSALVWRRMPVIFLGPIFAMMLLTIAGAHAGLRSIAAVAFLLLCPGLPWMWTLKGADFLVGLIMAMAGSVAIDVVVSEAMILAHLWSPLAGFVLLAAIGGIGLVLGFRKDAWR